MKNRLLEDIGDSQSDVPVRPARRMQAASPPAPQPQAAVAPPHAAAPAGVPDAPARPRAGVWRSRVPPAEPAPGPASAPPHPGRAPQWPHAPVPPAPVPPAASAHDAPSRASEPARAAPQFGPEIASFSSREPDWSIPLQPEPPPWTERWGRKALGWTLGLAALVALAGTGAWMVQETRVESTLAVVADHTPAQVAPAPAPAPATASVLAPEPLPPLKLLPPEQVAAQAADAPDGAAPPAAESGAAPPDGTGQERGAQASSLPAAPGESAAPAQAAGPGAPAALAAVPPPAKKPAAKPTAERRVAAGTAKRSRPDAKKPAPKPARERVVARAPAVPVRSAPAPAQQPAQQPDPESPLAETLRLCRAAGYHATACLKRGCEATRFGLVCRG